MASDTHPSAESNGAPRGLPPVAPPSGRFIAQLFLIPGLIVAVAVFIWLGSSYLVRSGQTPKKFLESLDSENAEIRWRGAHDLAQVLKRPESLALASDPTFALDLAERLHRAVADLEKAEKETRQQVEQAEKAAKQQGRELTQAERDSHWRKLSNPRNHVLYLTASLGDFTIPVGAPLLSALALKDTGAEVKGVTLRRRRAVWALANLGDNYRRRYLGKGVRPDEKALTPEQKTEVVAALKQEAKGTTERAEWARAALAYLQGTVAADRGVDAVLERVAGADDPYLRALVALALNFWDGPRVEPTLLRLARDDGHGQRIEITETD